MNLEEYLCKVIGEESDKLILRYHAYHNALHHEHIRNKKRISNPPKKTVKKPNYWDVDRKFNPFYVKKKSKSIARSIAKKISDKTYKPFTPHIKKIPVGFHVILSEKAMNVISPKNTSLLSIFCKMVEAISGEPATSFVS